MADATHKEKNPSKPSFSRFLTTWFDFGFQKPKSILLPIEEALYAYDQLRTKIRYKKTFLGSQETLKFEDFNDNQMTEVLEQALTYTTVLKQQTLFATRETQVVIHITNKYHKFIKKNFRMNRSSFNTFFNQLSLQ